MVKTCTMETRLLLPEQRIAEEDNIINIAGTNLSMIRDFAAAYEYRTLDDARLLSALSGIKMVQAMEILREYRLFEIEEYMDSLFPKITEHQKKLIKSAFEFSRRVFTKTPENQQYIKSPSDITKLFEGEMRYLKKEVFVIVHLNVKNMMTRKEVISVGNLNSSIVHPREVFANAVKLSAAGIILCHNHPSGCSQPSIEDIETTKRLVEAGNILGIKVLDHLIIGNGEYSSMKEQGLL